MRDVASDVFSVGEHDRFSVFEIKSKIRLDAMCGPQILAKGN